jgi:hypothetical protein
VKRFAGTLLRAVGRALGGAFGGWILALALLSAADTDAALVMALPMAIATGTLALLWPAAFGGRKRLTWR